MTRLTPLWSQPGSYPATTDRQLMRAIWPNGGVVGMAPAVVPETMQIQLDAGRVVVPDLDPTGGAWLCVSDAPERVQVGTAPPSGQDRIDLVAIAVDDGAPGWAPQVQPGNPASSPVQPTPTPGTFPICAIRVRGGSAVLQPGDITDLRYAIESQVPLITPAELSQPPFDNPRDGQLVDMLVAGGLIWRFRYTTAAAAGFPWWFIGGPAYQAFDETLVVPDQNAWRITTPSLVMPRDGRYQFTYRAEFVNAGASTAVVFLNIGPGDSAFVETPGASVSVAAGGRGALVGAGLTSVVNAGQTIWAKVQMSVAPVTNLGFRQRFIQCFPYQIR